jgi:cytochrome c
VLSFAINAYSAKNDIKVLPKPEPVSEGKLVYETMGCSICHGPQGKGDGPLASNLEPKPRNFTDFMVMSKISDMSMFHAIKNGIPDTAMRAWDLTDDQAFDVIAYIKTFLADNQMTINICLNEQRTVDLRNLKPDDNRKFDIDRKQFLKLSSSNNIILIKPEFTNVLRHFKKTGRKVVRTHVMVTRKGQTRLQALIAVRVSDCLK